MTDSVTDTIQTLVQRHAQAQAAAPLLIAPETQAVLHYGELAHETERFGRWAAAYGMAPGDRIAMLLPNGMQAGLIFLAAMASGYVIVPLNLLATPSQLRHCVRHSGARIVFSCRDLSDSLWQALEELATFVPQIIEVDPDESHFAMDGPATGHMPSPAPEQNALLMYTSGTTGTPKGVPLTHANLLHGARAVAAWHDLQPSDRVLSALPLYHINGQVIATLTPFVSGGSIVAPRRFSASRWWEIVDTHRCTWLNMVPTIIAYLLNAKPNAADASHSSVRFGRSASAPLPVEHHQAFERRFGIPIIEAMGMTETASVIFCNPQDPAGHRYGSPGLPCGVEVYIAGPDGERLADGQIGELVLRGPNVMAGYFDNPEENAKAFNAEGWLRTGDLGYRDTEGYFVITGRIKELIIKGGENIAPREIDEALLGHAAVLEAAAVGLPDADYGQEIYAAVMLKPGAEVGVEELLAYCKETLGRYKCPRDIRIVTELPKGPSGKVQRLKLVELWAPAAAPGTR